ncbi:MAG: hypothetical protein N2690_08950, partial [Rhodocyclaceae bacterium]|nr:hypothetical protein [Rhodocyclaceae bacterium]
MERAMKSISGTAHSARLDEIRRLKQEGLSMTEIIDRLSGEGKACAPTATPTPLHLTVDALAEPAYMLNQNFELVWINAAAQHCLFGGRLELPQTSEARSLFRLLPVGRAKWASLLNFHVGLAKARLSPESFG